MKQPAIANQPTSLTDETTQDLILWLRAANLTALYNSIGHELRGPLNAMNMNLEMLKYVLGDPLKNETDKPDYYIRILSESIHQLDQRLLVFFGYFAATAHQPLPLQKLLTEIEELALTQAHTQSVRMKITAPEEPLALQSHIPAWRQAILHLVVHGLAGLGRGDELIIEAGGSSSELRLRVYDSAATLKTAATAGLNKVETLVSRCGGSLGLSANPGNKNGICRELVIPLQ
jgi:signal transduction histidine kinase